MLTIINEVWRQMAPDTWDVDEAADEANNAEFWGREIFSIDSLV